VTIEGSLLVTADGADPVGCLRQAAVVVASEGDWEGLSSTTELPALEQGLDIA
jgi:hypothetical protein